MGLDASQLREFVVRPTLRQLAPEIPYSEGAVELLMGTAAQESHLTYLDQLTPGPGPAFGLWQMEAATHDDLWRWLQVKERSALRIKVQQMLSIWPSRLEQLRVNLVYAAAMCRVHYRRAPEPIPSASDIAGAGLIYKLRYNTPLGAATIEDYVRNYRAVRP